MKNAAKLILFLSISFIGLLLISGSILLLQSWAAEALVFPAEGGFFSGKIKPGTSVNEAKTILDGPAFKAYFHPVNLQKLARTEELAAKKGLSVPQIASAYAISHPLNIFSLQAPRGLKEMRENAAAFDVELTKDELVFLETGH